MSKYTLALLVTIIALGVFLLMKKSTVHSKTEEIKEKMTFHVEDVNDIHKIFIVKRGEKPVLLTRNGKGWLLDEQYVANPYIMEGIVDVLGTVRVQYIPSEAEVEGTMPILSAQGIKVEAYDKNDKQLISYYIGGVTQNEKGTHFYKEGGDKSYVMEMPYGESNIRQRFNIRYDDWKSRLIYDDRVENISSVKVEFPKSPANGFILENKNGEYAINPLNTSQPRIQREFKNNVFEKYLISYKGVNFVEYNNEVRAKDSILLTTPFIKQELVNRQGDTFRLTMWPKSKNIATPRQAHDINDPLNGYYAMDGKGDFGSVQQLVVQGTIAGYQDFFQ